MRKRQKTSLSKNVYLVPETVLIIVVVSDKRVKISFIKASCKYFTDQISFNTHILWLVFVYVHVPYLGWRHSNVWHSSSCKLYGSDTNTVNIRLHVVSLEILSKRNIVNIP